MAEDGCCCVVSSNSIVPFVKLQRRSMSSRISATSCLCLSALNPPRIRVHDFLKKSLRSFSSTVSPTMNGTWRPCQQVMMKSDENLNGPLTLKSSRNFNFLRSKSIFLFSCLTDIMYMPKSSFSLHFSLSRNSSLSQPVRSSTNSRTFVSGRSCTSS